MESNAEPGKSGAYRQTWRKGNPRSLLQSIINKNPKADEKSIGELFWREVEDDKELLRAIVGYWFDNNYRSLLQHMAVEPPAARRQREAARAAEVSKATEKIKDRVQFEAKRVLLDWIMPNNKKLADCTGAECRQFGGWLADVGKKVPPNSMVRQVFSEEALQKLWKK